MSKLKQNLRKNIECLISKKRNSEEAKKLMETGNWIKQELLKFGLESTFQKYSSEGQLYNNVIVSFNADKKKRIILGAHYDALGDIDGANDNASGVSGIIEIAKMIKTNNPKLKHRIDVVFYATEEGCFFGSNKMGSAIHAESLKREKAKILAAISVDMIGSFSEEEYSQKPMSLISNTKIKLPTKSNFILVTSMKNKKAIKLAKYIEVFGGIKSIGIVDKMGLSKLSDNISYDKYGFPAILINDTAFLRSLDYHTDNDTIDKLNFDKMSQVVKGLYESLKFLN